MANGVGGPIFPIRMDQFTLIDINNGTVLEKTATLYRVDEGDGFVARLTGTGLTYDANGRLTGGTLTGFDESFMGSSTFTISGASVSAVAYAGWVRTNDVASALNATFGGNDAITGGVYNDYLTGLTGNDTLIGGGGADTILGSDGSDSISGGAGADRLIGGTGGDVFYGTAAEMNGDTIADFVSGDSISITGSAANNFSYTLTGTTLSFAGQSLTLSGFTGRLAIGTGAQAQAVLTVNASPQFAAADQSGDGRADILWRNTNGSVSSWLASDGNGYAQNTYSTVIDSSWKIVETFDINADGRADILWRNTNGQVSVWTSTGTSFNQGVYTSNAISTSEWRIAGVGDFNGDGRDDLMWQNASGGISAWQSTGTGFIQNSYSHVTPGAQWKVAGTADFNGDGRDDILWRDTSGAISIWQSNGAGFAENTYFDSSVGLDWHIAGTGDFNGDGREDLIWRSSRGETSIWQSTGNGFAKNTYYDQSVPTSWSIAQVADINGDGKSDLLWRNSNGSVSTWLSNGQGFTQAVYNSASPIPTSWSVQAHDFSFG